MEVRCFHLHPLPHGAKHANHFAVVEKDINTDKDKVRLDSLTVSHCQASSISSYT